MTTLHVFAGGANDGASPRAALLDTGGILYGTTAMGGNGNCSSGCGTVFAMDPASGSVTLLHAFQDDDQDGMQPVAALINVNGTLYGTTEAGGSGGVGTVFSVNVSKKTETILYSFLNNGADGNYPAAPLLDFKGALYGTTENGGSGSAYPCQNGCGTVFEIDPASGAETIVHSFDTTDGESPAAGLTNVGGTILAPRNLAAPTKAERFLISGKARPKPCWRHFASRRAAQSVMTRSRR